MGNVLVGLAEGFEAVLNAFGAAMIVVVFMLSPPSTIPHISSLARDICPIPAYAPNPLVNNFLFSLNSSLLLSDHYRDVQNSLSPSELGDFTRRLRTTFGREGKVTMGGVGVVALSLALLFDTLAKEVKGHWVPESGPIPGLFLQKPTCKDPFVPVVSEYLRLVPHVANNPARMREETEKYIRKLWEISQTYGRREPQSGACRVNILRAYRIFLGLQMHHMRLSKSTVYNVTELIPVSFYDKESFDSSLNCDLEAANNEFKQELLRRNDTLEELKKYGTLKDTPIEEAFIPNIELVFLVLMIDLPATMPLKEYVAPLVQHREDFDLKAKSHLPF